MPPFKMANGQMCSGRVYDSSGAFLVGELERLDQTLHAPLTSFFWPRDIDLRSDVTLADEYSSYTLSSFSSQGALGTGNGIGNGKAWIGKTANKKFPVLRWISLRVANVLTLWDVELKYTIPEPRKRGQAGASD